MKAILVIETEAELPPNAYANVYVMGSYDADEEPDLIVHKKNVPFERHEKGEVSEEVKEEHRKMMKEIDAVRCELHHIESDNKMLKEVIIRMAMEHTGVVG